MKKKKLHIELCALSGILLLASACTDEQPAASIAEGTPLTITAEIDAAPSSATRAIPDYDLTAFRDDDQINVTCSRNSVQLGSAAYTKAGSSWTVPAGAGLGFLPAVVYQASFPVGYDGIRANQATADDFLKSNYLLTPPVPVSGVEVSFTGNYAFQHQNAKLTLKFTGANTLPAFSQMTVEASGLRTGVNATEAITMLQPDANAYTWCAVIHPKNTSTSISITVIDANGVTYKTTVQCAMAKGTSYTYTLNLQNNILVPVGSEIKDWKDESRYSGNFD